MTRKKAIHWITASVLLLVVTPALATIQKEYSDLVLQRKELERQREQLDSDSRNLENSRRAADRRHVQCSSGRWRVLWQYHVEKAEKERTKLEEQNDDLAELNLSLRKKNSELDTKRQEIEAAHRHKNSDYESAFRSWMDKLKNEYFFPLESRLFRGYKEYMNGIELYLTFINNSADACENREYAQAVLETIVAIIPKIAEASRELKEAIEL